MYQRRVYEGGVGTGPAADCEKNHSHCPGKYRSVQIYIYIICNFVLLLHANNYKLYCYLSCTHLVIYDFRPQFMHIHNYIKYHRLDGTFMGRDHKTTDQVLTTISQIND